MERYYLYKHTNKKNMKAYIGITVQKPEIRWGSNGINYRNNRYFWNAIKKYGWDNFSHEVLFESINKKEIEALEEKLISDLKTSNRKHGYNIALGGRLNRHSRETKEFLSKIGTGRILTEEHKKNISNSLKGKMPKNRKNNKNPKSEEVIAVEIETKRILSFSSFKDAANSLNVPASSVSQCARGLRNKSHGFLFFYKNKFLGIQNIDFSNIDYNPGNSKIILAINKNEILEFQTMNEAAEFAGIHRATMRRYCKESRLYKGYVWSFK